MEEERLQPVIPVTVTQKTKKILLIGGCGYIGSYLDLALRSDGYWVDICDACYRGRADKEYIHWYQTHQELDPYELRRYDTVLFFAGISNVKDAATDPLKALEENCTNLYDLRRTLPDHTRLIYASSGSLYSLPLDAPETSIPPWSAETDPIGPGLNAYDRSKACFDNINLGFLKNTVGLRMGTLCGWSPNLRPDLLFNAMCLSALKDGVVHVANPTAWRSILFLDKLYVVVKSLIDALHVPKILNVASRNTTIGELGTQIAQRLNARIYYDPPTPTYNFRMNTDLMYSLTYDTLNEFPLYYQIDKFVRDYQDAE